MRSSDTGDVTGNQTLASAFVVRVEQVVSVSRYPDLVEALHAADLDESHETRSD